MSWIRITNGGRWVINTDLIKTFETPLVSSSPLTWTVKITLTTGDAYTVTPTFSVRADAEALILQIIAGNYWES